MNKELLRMQMLAGIITESQYKAMLNEEMFGWDEGDLTEEELKKVKLLMSLKPYEDKINNILTHIDSNLYIYILIEIYIYIYIYA